MALPKDWFRLVRDLRPTETAHARRSRRYRARSEFRRCNRLAPSKNNFGVRSGLAVIHISDRRGQSRRLRRNSDKKSQRAFAHPATGWCKPGQPIAPFLPNRIDRQKVGVRQRYVTFRCAEPRNALRACKPAISPATKLEAPPGPKSPRMQL